MCDNLLYAVLIKAFVYLLIMTMSCYDIKVCRNVEGERWLEVVVPRLCVGSIHLR